MRLLLALAFLYLTTMVAAHGYVSNPQPRARTISGHPFQYEPQSDGSPNAVCRDNGRSGPIAASYRAGQTITISTTVTAYHGGWHELWLCPRAVCGSLNDFTQVARSLRPSSVPGCPTAAPPGSTDKPCLSPANNRADLTASGGQFQFQLPSGFTCSHCTMMWWWITNNYGNEHFKSCHDISISGGFDSMNITDAEFDMIKGHVKTNN